MSESSQATTVIPAANVQSYDRTAEYLLLAQIIGATFLQKIAIPLGGNTEFFFGFFWMMGITAYGFLSKKLEVRKERLVLFMIMVGGMCLSQIMGNASPSLLSFLPLLLAHVHYAFGLKNGMSRPGIELEYFQKIMLIIAGLGIFQYFMQYLVGSHWAFLMESFVPDKLYKDGFNGMNALSYGSDRYKSNGIFFLEPAIFCQFLSIAIIIELWFFKNLKRLLVYIVAVAVTFSGTGLVILFMVVPMLLLSQKKYGTILCLAALFLSAPLWAPYVGLGMQIERASEITNTQTSGYARFISMFPFINLYILNEPSTFFFGRGAGSIPWDGGILASVDYEIFSPSWAKLFFEYGAVGSIFYLCLMAYVFISPPRSKYLKIGLIIQFVLLGEYMIPPTVHGIVIALLAWPSLDGMKKFGDNRKEKPLKEVVV
jgi:hypothetical protein